MPEPTIRIVSSALLMVEGTEEQRFWQALFRDTDYAPIQVVPTEGKDNLGNVLRAITLTPGFPDVAWLGIMQDADDRTGSAFQRICNALGRAGLPVPARPWTMASDMTRAVVAFVLPDGQAGGDLETLVWQALGTEPAVPCVDAYLQCLASGGLTLPRQLSKARVHTYLASLPRPALRLAEAAQAHALPFTLDHPVFAPLRALLPTP